MLEWNGRNRVKKWQSWIRIKKVLLTRKESSHQPEERNKSAKREGTNLHVGTCNCRFIQQSTCATRDLHRKWHFCFWSYEFPITSTMKHWILLASFIYVLYAYWSWYPWYSELVNVSFVHDDMLATLWPSVEDSQFWWAWPDLEYASSNGLLLAYGHVYYKNSAKRRIFW